MLTVSVSVAAGTAALASAFPVLTPYTIEISIAFVILIAFGNLRGVRESGRIFAVPDLLLHRQHGDPPRLGHSPDDGGHAPSRVAPCAGTLALRPPAGGGLLLGASAFIVLRAFASGGAAVTGVEAISNGVPAFKKPAWKNARTTLVIMGSLLGVMFLGLSVLAAHLHVVPFTSGTPTVISQIGDLVYGSGRSAASCTSRSKPARCSSSCWPPTRASPTSRGWRRSTPATTSCRASSPSAATGSCSRTASSSSPLPPSSCWFVTGARVDKLIPLYAIGVFTSFTLSQAGMAKHHITHKEDGWRFGLFVNGTGAVLSLLVDIIIAITKFPEGAWIIILFVPIMVFFLVRLAKQYEREAHHLEVDVPAAVQAPVMRRLVVLVFIDRLDLAAAQAIQFGRSLNPSELRAVHFVIDHDKTEELSEMWREHGLANIPLDLVDCPDRRLNRSAMTTVAQALADGKSEVCVVLAERRYGRFWGRILHDHTADALARDISQIPHANVTTVPFHLGKDNPVVRTNGANGNGAHASNGHAASNGSANSNGKSTLNGFATPNGAANSHGSGSNGSPSSGGQLTIADVRWRQRVKITGQVTALRVQPIAGVGALECTLGDDTAGILVVFLGRRKIAGIGIGTRMTVEGIVIEHHGRLAIVNPVYELRDPRAL